jgi:NADPH-dependent 2,4-dienoyl-CoA reductase/sulfur reductase-like enzyme/rhodanese-related sulfurtransferase
MKVLIIGGVAAGMSAATRLRRLKEDAEIIVFEMGENVSYANCGLPYFISDVIENRDELLLQTPQKLHDRFRLDVRVKTKVIAIDKANRTVTAQNLLTNVTETVGYDKLVITTGATPRRIEIPGAERALALRDVSDADAIKSAISQTNAKTAAILGGGFIGIELAENLRHLGIEVTIIQRSKQILPQFDIEIIEVLQKRLEENGIKLKLNSTAVRIGEDQVELSSGENIAADLVFSAAGVIPDNQLAQAAGLGLGPTGGLKVNQHQQTSDPDIFAAGDAVEKLGQLTGLETLIPLANLANRHGRLIADAIAGKPAHAHDSLGTAIIGAFGMAAAMTGLTEASAKKNNIDYQAIHLHPGSHAGYYPGAKRLSLKVLFDPYNGKLLGAQAIGEDGADKRIDVIATAIYGNLTIDDLMNLELSYAPQFGSAKDPINHAGYLGNNVNSGQTPTLQWYQLKEELKQPNTVLVDVRTNDENQAGSIPNALNIDVNVLRENLDQLKGKQVIVHCQVGQRGHIATQILKAHGISATNLDGGYLTWRSGMDALNRK